MNVSLACRYMPRDGISLPDVWSSSCRGADALPLFPTHEHFVARQTRQTSCWAQRSVGCIHRCERRAVLRALSGALEGETPSLQRPVHMEGSPTASWRHGGLAPCKAHERLHSHDQM